MNTAQKKFTADQAEHDFLADDPAKPTCGWWLYLLECRGGVLYAGITNDLQRRFDAHVCGKGAKFTRAHPPIRIAAARAFADRSSASKAEWAVKQLPKARKVPWVMGYQGLSGALIQQ